MKLNRMGTLAGLAAWMLAAWLCAFAAANVAVAAPTNVLLIMCDDLRPLLGCYDDPLAKTPNIDRLAARGVCFVRAYSNYPVCGPSRASMLSGLRPTTTGYYGWEYVPNVPQLPAWFRQRGHYTAEFGKVYHTDRIRFPKIGEAPGRSVFVTQNPPGCWDVSDNCVTEADLDGYGYHYSATMQDEPPALAAHIAARGSLTPPAVRGAWHWLEWVETTLPDEQTSDGLVARRAAETIERTSGQGQPFFVAAGLRRPHQILAAPKPYFDLYALADIPPPPAEPREHIKKLSPLAFTYPVKEAYHIYSDEDRRVFERAYRANIAYCDAQIGLLLDTLDRLSLWDSTVVALTTDHGWHLGEHGGLVQKHTLFEESTRVPFVLAAPGFEAGRVCKTPIELVDLIPTLCDLCQIEPPAKLDGLSLRPLLADRGATLPRAGAVSTVRRLITADMRAADPKLPRQPVLGLSLRTPRWRYSEWQGGEFGRELYDEDRDPRELNNLADDAAHAKIAARLKAALARELARTNDTRANAPQSPPASSTP